MTYYNEKLMELKEKMDRMDRVESILVQLKKQKKELTDKIEELRGIKEKEQADVEQLEGRSLANFFYHVMGKQEERISKEKEEAYAAAVKYDAAVKEKEMVKADIEKRQEELRSLWGCEREYQALYEEKIQFIQSSGNEVARELFQLEKEMVEWENQKREIKEAILAGKQALNQTESILETLDRAENWGTWDLIGGGLVTDMVKHSHLDEAQEMVEQLQVFLRRFQTEMKDIKVQEQLQVNVNGFLWFADYFFDGLFADWAVLKRIENSKEQVLKVKKDIMDALRHLEGLLLKAEQEYGIRKSKKEDLIWETEVEMPKR